MQKSQNKMANHILEKNRTKEIKTKKTPLKFSVSVLFNNEWHLIFPVYLLV